MPEFVLEGREHAARMESEFVLGFIEALFFTECDCCTDAAQWGMCEADGTLPRDVGYADLHPQALQDIRRYCEMWQDENAALLQAAYARGYDERSAGADLWYTVNGHGVGFLDRKELDSEGLGNALSDAAGRSEIHVFFGDHVTYGNAPFVHVDL